MELHGSFPLARLLKNKVSRCETQYAEAGAAVSLQGGACGSYHCRDQDWRWRDRAYNGCVRWKSVRLAGSVDELLGLDVSDELHTGLTDSYLAFRCLPVVGG